MLHADAAPRVPDDLLPAACDRGLDADPGADRGRQHLVAEGLLLRAEPFHARHGHHPGGDSLGLQLMAGVEGDLYLGAGADHDDLRGAAVGFGEDVPAARGAVGGGIAGGLAAADHGYVLPAEDHPGGAVAVLDDRPPANAGLVRVARPHYVEAGDGAQRSQVLDWLVGRPVLAEPDRIVGPYVDRGQLH